MITPRLEALAEAATLTDDELVAVAADASRPWPAPLPSVDSGVEGELAAALRRGVRSAVVRGLHRDGHWVESIELLRSIVLKGRIALMAFLGTDDGQISGAGNVTSFYRATDDRWLSEITTPMGVHLFTVSPARSCVQFVVDAAHLAYEAGVASPDWPNGTPAPAGFCVGSGISGKPVLMSVAKGRCAVCSIGETGTRRRLELNDLEAALGMIVAGLPAGTPGLEGAYEAEGAQLAKATATGGDV